MLRQEVGDSVQVRLYDALCIVALTLAVAHSMWWSGAIVMGGYLLHKIAVRNLS